MRGMSDERRQHGPDRRRHARGGRRPEDRTGFAPLVMVVDSDHQRRELSEAILAKLQFAVAPVDSIEKAISVATALKPAVIVCPPLDAGPIGERLQVKIPIVPIDAHLAVTEQLVEVVRGAIRGSSF